MPRVYVLLAYLINQILTVCVNHSCWISRFAQSRYVRHAVRPAEYSAGIAYGSVMKKDKRAKGKVKEERKRHQKEKRKEK